MCANFEAIRKNRAFLLDLPEPDQLEFPEYIFPNYPSPLIFSNDELIKIIGKARQAGPRRIPVLGTIIGD